MDISKVLLVNTLVSWASAWLVFTGEYPYHKSFSIKTTAEKLHGHSLLIKISSMVDLLDFTISKFEAMRSNDSDVEPIWIECNPDDPNRPLGRSMAFMKGPEDELRDNCHRMGGKLVRPSSKSQFDFVKEAFLAKSKNLSLSDG